MNEITEKTENRRKCPDCGGVVVLVADGFVGELIVAPFTVIGGRTSRYVMTRKRFWACSACEYCEIAASFVR